MSQHPSTSQIEHFCLSALPEDELATVAVHVADCQSCQHQFAEKLRHQKGSAPISFTLAPEFWFRHDHVDFEHLVGLADDKLDAGTREIIDIHLNVCERCREDIRSFLAFRKQSAREMEISYGPTSHASQREGLSGLRSGRGWGWKPTYAVAAVVLAALALVVTAFVLNRRSETLETKRNEPTPINILASPTPGNNNAVSLPSPPPSPEPSRSPDMTPSPTIDTSTAVAVLKDGRGEVTLDKSGHVAGLDEISSISRQEIAQALLTGRFDRPAVLITLGGEESNLRGNNMGRTFKLLYPTRRVIIEDRPMCRWESLTGASSYKVYVLDSKGNAIVTSEKLAPSETHWAVKASLKRGEVFSWVVTAVVDGKEIVSPAPSAPEMKFAVLSIKEAQELTQLKKTRSHLALGVFYAKAGLLTEAERELQRLVQLNPQSLLPRKLLQSARSLRQTK